jgi:regulator of sirC expression with transglutaminase-like and TPR domain
VDGASLKYFQLLCQDPNKIPLTEAAIEIGRIDDPKLDAASVQEKIDRLSMELAKKCRDQSTEIGRLQALIAFVYRDRHFGGNHANYYDPSNSFLHRVLQTQQGIPITLNVLLLELASSIGLEAWGLGFPGHFLTQFKTHQGLVIIDPFTGRSLGVDELKERAGPASDSLNWMIQAASSRQTLIRMLNNLRKIYEVTDRNKLIEVLERLVILQPDNQGLKTYLNTI